MRRERFSFLAVLDEAAELVTRELPGWAGLAVLTALPLRFLEAHFLNRVLELGKHAGEYGRYLVSVSWLVTLALPLAFWGRAVLAHAVVLALSGERRVGRQAWKLRPAALAAGFYAFLFTQLLFLAFSATLAGAVAAVLLSGLAAATVPLQEKVGPLAPLGTVFRHARPFRVYAGLLFLAALAFVVAYVNLAPSSVSASGRRGACRGSIWRTGGPSSRSRTATSCSSSERGRPSSSNRSGSPP